MKKFDFNKSYSHYNISESYDGTLFQGVHCKIG